MPLFLRLFRHKRALLLSFVLVYGLGLALFMAVDSLARHFGRELEYRSKELLEGELRIESRRRFTEAESAAVQALKPPGTREAHVWGFLSMIKAGDHSRMVQVKGISDAYPLVGQFVFKGSGDIGDLRPGEILFPRELLIGLKARVGDTVRLGRLDFVIKDEYVQSPGGGLRFMDLGSKVYIPLSDVERSGLDQKGSRIFRYRFHLFPPDTDLKALKAKLERVLDDPEIEVDIHTESDSRLGRSFDMVAAFLRMVSLTALLLSAVGASFFFHHHLVGERRIQAVLAILGHTRSRIAGIYMRQNVLLALLAAGAGGVFALALGRVLPALIYNLFALEVAPGLHPGSFLLATALSVTTSLLFGLSSFLRIGRQSPSLLIKPTDEKVLGPGTRAGVYGLQTTYFLALGLFASGSWMLSLLFIGSISAAFGCLSLIALGAYRVLSLFRGRADYRLKIVLGAFRWNKEKSLMAFGALGLVAFSSALLPQLQFVVRKELRAPEGTVVPQLFLFDIQEEQLGPLNAFLDSAGHPLRHPAPMVRARLERLNGEAFKKALGESATLEERERKRLRNRGFNLSYRDSLSKDEELVEGRLWKGPAEDGGMGRPAEVSVEKDFAGRFGLEVGDKLVFDVQGVEVEGRITSLRRVRWASFQPNFFILFQPGVLDMAPKTFLGTLERMPLEESEVLQAALTDSFPNVTALNVKDIVTRSLEILGKLEWLVSFLSSFALLIGLAILGIIIDGMVRDGRRNILLLRTLGATSGSLARLYFTQYLLFCLLAGVAGYVLSLGAVWLINAVLWEFPWAWNPGVPAASLLGAAAVGAACGFYAVFRHRGRRLRHVLELSRL